MCVCVYSRTPLIRINWDGEPSGYAKKSGYLDFSLKIDYISSLKRKKKVSTNGCFTLHIYLCTNKTITHNSLYVFDKWGNV